MSTKGYNEEWHPYELQNAIILGSTSLDGGKSMHDVLYYSFDDETLIQNNHMSTCYSWNNECDIANSVLSGEKCIFTDNEYSALSRDIIIDIVLLLIEHKYAEALEYIRKEDINIFQEIGFLYHHNETVLINILNNNND